jgi:hypothetical protein
VGKKMVQRSKQNNIPIMQSTPGFSQIKSFISNINTEDREITCFDAHAIPDNDSWEINEDLNKDEGNPIVNNRDQNLNTTNNTPYRDSIEPVDQNTSTESTGPHLIKTFEQSKQGHLPEGIQDHLPEGIQDPNPSATNSTPKNPSATNSAPKCYQQHDKAARKWLHAWPPAERHSAGLATMTRPPDDPGKKRGQKESLQLIH